MSGINIIKSNFRFFRNNFFLNVLKLMINSAGMTIAGYFYCGSLMTGTINVRYGVIALFVTATMAIVYYYLQGVTLKSRISEIFIRKWYGGKPKDIFFSIFAEPLIIIGFSVLISFLMVDIVSEFRFFSFLLQISEIRGFYLTLLFHAILLGLIGSIHLKKLSDSRISELTTKIS